MIADLLIGIALDGRESGGKAVRVKFQRQHMSTNEFIVSLRALLQGPRFGRIQSIQLRLESTKLPRGGSFLLSRDEGFGEMIGVR